MANDTFEDDLHGAKELEFGLLSGGFGTGGLTTCAAGCCAQGSSKAACNAVLTSDASLVSAIQECASLLLVLAALLVAGLLCTGDQSLPLEAGTVHDTAVDDIWFLLACLLASALLAGNLGEVQGHMT